jgi:selenocysteine lyase/cysteine desulfurase
MGAALVVDACQAAGIIPLDVGRIQPDFLVSAAYKWLLGPYSVGFCWVAPNRREGRPLEQNWITRSGSDDFAGLVDYCDDYAPGARRYDMGEVSNFALLPVAISSMELLVGWGLDAVASHAQTLTSAIADGAAGLGFAMAAQPVRSPHLLGLRLPAGLDTAVVVARLQEHHVHVSVRGSSLRVSIHVFNTADDVESLLQVLGFVANETPPIT